MQSPAAFNTFFGVWTKTFGKPYDASANRTARADIFRQNIQRMIILNSDPTLTFWFQPGPYTDLTDAEFAGVRWNSVPRKQFTVSLLVSLSLNIEGCIVARLASVR
jgi:hypothetical protein